MTRILRVTRTVVALGFASSFLPATGYAQSGPTQRTGANIGVTAGGFFDKYEGQSASGVAGSVTFGMD